MSIRDVPDDVVSAIDARAARLGLSRTQYLQRRLAQEIAAGDATLSVDDLRAFSAAVADLADQDVMSKAWT